MRIAGLLRHGLRSLDDSSMMEEWMTEREQGKEERAFDDEGGMYAREMALPGDYTTLSSSSLPSHHLDVLSFLIVSCLCPIEQFTPVRLTGRLFCRQASRLVDLSLSFSRLKCDTVHCSSGRKAPTPSIPPCIYPNAAKFGKSLFSIAFFACWELRENYNE